jgi:NADPH-dependent 2,4-dienoyl-CoA reductase/sulfur reductase-like enzyme
MSAARIDVLVVGAGLAGARLAETLRSAGFDGGIVVAGDEPHAPYERPALSKEFLFGGGGAAELALRPDGFWEEQGIDLRPATPVEWVNLGERTARFDGGVVRWRKLVLATGARARAIPGLPALAGVHRLRTLADATALRQELRPGARLVVIGAGFVGVEVASSALALGATVTVVEALQLPLATILGAPVAVRIAERARRHGVDLRLGVQVREVVGDGRRARAVELADGTRIECDAVLVAVGAQPNTELMRGQLELAADGGVPTDGSGRTEHPDVLACGDVASVRRTATGRHTRLEHWTAAAGTGRAAAFAILGEERPDTAPPYFWSDHFGWRVQMVGHPMPDDAVAIDGDGDGFVARYEDRDGNVQAALAVNRPGELPALRREVALAAERGALARH